MITTSGKDFLSKGIVALLIAGGGIGKTYALFLLAVAIAAGRPWLEIFLPKRAGRVLLLIGEEDRLEVRRRLYRAFSAMDLSEAERESARLNIHADGLLGIDVALFTTQPGQHRFDPPEETEWGRALLRTARDSGPWDLVVFDPMSRWNGSMEENNNRQGTLFIETLERFTALPGNPVVLVAAHTPKSERSGAQARTPRGASAVFDGARFVVALADDADGSVVLSVEKSNYTRRPESIRLMRVAGGLLSYVGIANAGPGKPVPDNILAQKIFAYLRTQSDAWLSGNQIRVAVGDPSGTRFQIAISSLGGKIESRPGPRNSTLYHARPPSGVEGGQGDLDY